MLPGPEYADCGCGCGLYGALRVRAWRNGVHCVRRCSCRQCQGGRTKARARRREGKMARQINAERTWGSGVIAGYDLGGANVEIEETANVALVAGLKRWWFSKQVQTKLARLLARSLRPRFFVASWDGKPRLVVGKWEDFVQVLALQELANVSAVKEALHKARAAVNEAEARL
jgi:hypothetical protein